MLPESLVPQKLSSHILHALASMLSNSLRIAGDPSCFFCTDPRIVFTLISASLVFIFLSVDPAVLVYCFILSRLPAPDTRMMPLLRLSITFTAFASPIHDVSDLGT